MGRDFVSIGPTPSGEPCQQVGTATYDHAAARAECRRFIDAIRATLGEEPDGARLSVKSNPHDFGSYLEVVCYFDDEDETATEYAYRCESDAPEYWPEDHADAPTHEPNADDADIVTPTANMHGHVMRFARTRQDDRTYYIIMPGRTSMTSAEKARETVAYWRSCGWIQEAQ